MKKVLAYCVAMIVPFAVIHWHVVLLANQLNRPEAYLVMTILGAVTAGAYRAVFDLAGGYKWVKDLLSDLPRPHVPRLHVPPFPDLPNPLAVSSETGRSPYRTQAIVSNGNVQPSVDVVGDHIARGSVRLRVGDYMISARELNGVGFSADGPRMSLTINGHTLFVEHKPRHADPSP